MAFALPAYAGIDPQLATAAGWVVALVAGWPLTMWLLQLAVGRATLSSIAVMLTAAATAAGGYTWVRADWLFDERGQPLAYICQGLIPGHQPRIQRQPVDHQLGGHCPVVDREVAKVLVPLLHRRRAPEAYVVPVASDVTIYDTMSGAPLVWAGTPREGEAGPALYAGPSFDPLVANTLLRPAKLDDLRMAIRARDQKAKLDKANTEARRKEVTAAVELERAEVQAQREASAREREQQEVAARERSRQEAATVAALSSWQRHFRQALDASDTLVVFAGEPLDSATQDAIGRDVIRSGSFWNARTVATADFFQTVQVARIFNRDYSSMSQVKWHPALRNVVYVQVVRCPDGTLRYCVHRTRLSSQQAANDRSPDKEVRHA